MTRGRQGKHHAPGNGERFTCEGTGQVPVSTHPACSMIRYENMKFLGAEEENG
jgi:hypothetical protein